MGDLYHNPKPRPAIALHRGDCSADLWLVDGFAVCSRGCGRLIPLSPRDAAEMRRLGLEVIQAKWWKMGIFGGA
jgi:hypothetical protein